MKKVTLKPSSTIMWKIKNKKRILMKFGLIGHRQTRQKATCEKESNIYVVWRRAYVCSMYFYKFIVNRLQITNNAAVIDQRQIIFLPSAWATPEVFIFPRGRCVSPPQDGGNFSCILLKNCRQHRTWNLKHQTKQPIKYQTIKPKTAI